MDSVDDDEMVEDNGGANGMMIGMDFEMDTDSTMLQMGPNPEKRKSLVKTSKKIKLGNYGIIGLKKEAITNYFHLVGTNSRGN